MSATGCRDCQTRSVWLHADIFDFEEAFRLNQEGAAIARELKFPEGEANSYINLAANYLVLGEPERRQRPSAGCGRACGRRRLVSLGV